MKFLGLGPVGDEIPAVIDDNGVPYVLSSLTHDRDRAFLTRGGIDEVSRALAAGSLERLGDPAYGSVLQIGTPIARPSDLIFGVAEIVRQLSHFMVLEPGDLNLGTQQQHIA